MPSNAEHKQDTNEPAHTAFTNYRLLQVQDALREQVFVHDRQSFPDYRLNMCATSREHTKWYFVACTDFINVYEVCGTHLSREPAGVIRRCVMDGSIFNAIKVGHLTPEMEVLVGVGDYGEVVVWQVDKMDFEGTGALSRQPQVLWYTINGDNISTWGIALHESGLLAVSANDHVIQVYNLAKTLNLPNITNALGDKDHIELIGHEHNVPTIDIDASGRFLASGSIDNSCRLWDLTTGKQVAQRTLGSGERQRRAWCWGVKFIAPGGFKRVQCRSKELASTLGLKKERGRLGSMHHVPVSNSAPFPVVRIERPDALDSDDELASVLYDVVRYTMPSIDPAQFPSDAIVTQEQFSRLREAVEQELLRQQEERIRIMQEPDQPEHIRRRLQELAQDTETNNRSIMIGAHIEARDIYRRQMEEERDEEQAGTSRGQQSREQEEQQPEQSPLQQEQHEHDQLQQEQQEHDQLQPNQQERDQLQENNGWPQEEDEQQEAENESFDVNDQQADEMTNEQGEADRIYARVAAMEDDDEANLLEETLDMLREEWGNDIRGDDPDDVEPLNPFDTRSIAPIPAPTVEPGGWDSPVAGNIMWGGNTQTTAPANWQETQELPAQAPNQDYWQPINDDLEMSDGYTDDAADDDSDSQEEEFDWSFRDHPMNTRTVPEVKLPLRDMLMLTTQKDCHLLAYNAQRTQKEPLSFVTLQMQRRVVSNVDIRMDHELRNLDRLCFLEWVPELELCIMGSQMGCVVLMRVLQVPLPDGEHTYVFNHERYLPLRTLHRHPLYGMTVRRLPSSPMDIYPNYVLDLVYADSCIYSYILSPADPQYNLLFHV